MKVYTKLPVPTVTAWERKTWRRYAPIWLKNFIDGVSNITRWIPTLYRDRDWDDFYITKLLQKKIEFQREYIVSNNRHTGVEGDNRDMTWALNLVERKHFDYYSLEKYDYEKSNIEFIPSKSHPSSYEVKTKVEWEKWDDYLSKYRGAVRRMLKQNPILDPKDKQTLVFYLGKYNQKRCEDLLWKIMSERSNGWWD